MTREDFDKVFKSLEVQISELEFKKRKLYMRFAQDNPYNKLSGKTVQIQTEYKNSVAKSEPFVLDRVEVDCNGFITAYGKVGKREVAFSLTSNHTKMVEV